MKYKWKRNALGGVKADIVGKEITNIIKENDGANLPETLVKRARNPKSPLHNCFEWNDTKAAEAYRIEQAGYMLRQIVIITEDEEPIEIRAFVNIESEDDNKGYYTTIQNAVESPELYKNLEQQIYEELVALKKKAKNLPKFRKVWLALDKVKIKRK